MTTVRRQLEVGKIYSFNTYAPEVLGLNHLNVKCLAVMNAATALAEGVDLRAMHERMRPHLPTGYNNDPFNMVYVKLQNSSEKVTIFAMDWINLDTIQEVNPSRIVATIEGVSINDMELIRKCLVRNGYTNVSLVLTEI